MTAAKESPIAQLIDRTLAEAVSLCASDVHFEIFDEKFVIRYRVNGELITLNDCPQEIAIPVCSRIKVLANLNISETRLPQDGEFSMTFGGNEIEFRVSCIPTQFGESLVLRVLNNQMNLFALDEIMKNEEELKNFLKDISKKSGLTLFVGPTGCGKSTTLYSVLREINNDEIKILSCEDPVEQRINGISQSNIFPSIGFSFACALRAFLRHDPDVILVGEIRDQETAALAVRAAITGHCVLSTLHANDVAGAVPRLLDLRVDKILVAEALLCVVHQQLKTSSSTKLGRCAEFTHMLVDKNIRESIKAGKF